MRKRFLSAILAFVMLMTSLPFTVLAEDSKPDFVHKVDTIEDMVPDGYVGIFAEEHFKLIEEDPDGYFILMNDIELSSSFSPICQNTSFTGVFEGNGHTISNLNLSVTANKTTAQYLGLFGCINGARVADVAVEGSVKFHIGSFSSYISSYAGIGGVVGYATGNAIIENCLSDVTITVTDTTRVPYKCFGVGGILGLYTGANSTLSVKYCRNLGNVTIDGSGTGVAGVFGGVEATNCTIDIFACHNKGKVKSNWIYNGGIIGEAQCAQESSVVSIGSCANEGSVISTDGVGGIAGYLSTPKGYSTIQDSLNTGYIEATGAPSAAAGIAGQLNNGTATRCINRATIEAAPKGCAILGYMNDVEDVTDCYWNDTCTTTTSWAGADRTGALPEANMTKQELYPALSFDDVWMMLDGNKQPFPTELAMIEFTNTYKELYVTDTITFSDASYKYSKIMQGSGAGSFASILQKTFETDNLDNVNKIWSSVEFVNDFLNSDIELENQYYALLADLVAGQYGLDIGEDVTSDNLLASASTLTEEISVFFDLELIQKAEKNLIEVVAKANNKNYSACGTLLEEILEASKENCTMDKLGQFIGNTGMVLKVGAAMNEGLDDAKEIMEFSILCNAFSDTIYDIGEMLKEASTYSMRYNEEEGKKAYEVCYDFANKMEGYAENNQKAFYEAGSKTVSGMAAAGLSSVYAIAVGAEIIAENPVLKGIKAGFTLGMPLANGLTKMDEITYNGEMLWMTGILAQGMYDLVQEKYDAFAHTKSYEDAEALNLASELYLILQIQACDYAIAYAQAKAAGLWGLGQFVNKKDVAAAGEIQNYKNELMELKNHGEQLYIGKDGSINGFIAMCPVAVTVTDTAGNQIAKLETGKKTIEAGYESSYQLLGDNDEHKSGIFSPKNHEVTMIGEEDGTMNLVTYATKNGNVTTICEYEDVPVTEGGKYTLDGTTLIAEDGSVVEPTSMEEYAYNPFTDIQEDTYYYEPVLWAVKEEITSGISKDKFGPEENCTRGQVVTFLWRTMGCPEPTISSHPFVDVHEGDYFYKPVLWAVENGITSGTDATHFTPNANVTRGQFVTFLYRAKGKPAYTNKTNPFVDVVKGPYYYDPILWAVENKITSGINANHFGPENNCTRGQVVTFLYRAYA